MTSIPLQAQLTLRQSYAFMARNFHLIKRYWAWEIVWITYATVNSLAVTFIAEGSTTVAGTSTDSVSRFTLFLLIGTLVWHYMSVIFTFVSEVIQWERWEGTIEYTLMAPVNRWIHLIGQTLFSIVYSLLTTILIGIVMTLFFNIDLSEANLLGALVLLIVGSLSLIGISIFSSILPLLYPERGAQMTHIIQAMFLLVSGIYYPIEVLPNWMQFLSRLSPVTYVLDGIRAALMDGAGFDQIGGLMFPLLLSAVIFVPFGVWTFQQAENYAKRTGKLKRVG
ncbi:MAG: ABC transporter permease [Phototrophicaceae bacterium]|jgi:ABC-2 type transport system permease protein